MSEFLTARKVLSAAALALVLAGCTESGNGSGDSAPPFSGDYAPAQPTTDTIESVTTRINCYLEGNPLADCDKDGVSNLKDVVWSRDDLADDDRDGVLNNRDRYHFLDDKRIDIDSDTIPDYLDTFFGPNYTDIDGDGWANYIDAQPYTAPPANRVVARPPGMTNQQLSEYILNMQMQRKFTLDTVDKPDTDYDGIPDERDPTRTEYTNDRDGDGDNDFYDPEANDPHRNSRNDPYDPRNDEYWDRDY
jgi:hypothetical protein